MDYLQIGSLSFERNASKSDMRLDFCSTLQESALDCGDLAFDTLEAEVFTNTAGPQLAALATNTPIVVYRSNEVYARFVKLTVSRIAPNSYRITGRSPMAALVAMAHPGGIYTGQTAGDIVKEICGSIPVLVESVYSNLNLYGWLPYADGKEKSARDNLTQVLFAIGAYLRTDLNGVLRIEKAWDGTASTIPADRSYSGGTVDYASPISSVSVTEHQYVANSDEKELFSGTTQTGDTVTFSEPMHSLSAEGFSILESNANYAKLSAGTGTLRGKTYTHNTRLVTRTVTEGAAENVISVTDATLVSLVNSVAVAKRLVEYYKHRETISNGVVAGAEKPGHVVSIYHPYDKKMVSACVESLDTTMSGTIKSNLVALVGFKPPQPDTSEYYDQKDVLTSAGTAVVPDGVTSYLAVLISGGDGGQAGADGASGTDGSSSSHPSKNGGSGGKGGAAGNGGKILVVNVDVSPGDTISWTIGAGGAPGTENGSLGSAGGATTLTVNGVSYSSDDGSSSAAGYTDQTTGDVYGTSGEAGTDGGAGGATNTAGADVGTSPGGEQGQTYRLSSSTGYGGGGGGAAVGGAGSKGGDGYVRSSSYRASGGNGGTGGNAEDITTVPSAIGTGGHGGHGGGGGGGGGDAIYSGSAFNEPGTGGAGGKGGKAGAGASGGLLLFYRMTKTAQTGPLVTSDNKWLLDSLGRRMIV